MDDEKKKDFVEFKKKDNSIEDFRVDEQAFLVLDNFSSIDVLDESLYSYDNAVFGLSSSVQDKASESLFQKIEQFINSIPAMQKVRESIQTKTEFIVRDDLIPKEIKEALKRGTAEIIPCKSEDNAFFLQIRTTTRSVVINGKEYGKNRKIKDIPLGTKSIPADITGAIQCLSMQNQLNQISSGLNEISQVCEFSFGRLIQGQRDDRIAELFSSRSSFIQALTLSDNGLKQNMLVQAICDANSARAKLAMQIKSDIQSLANEKKLKSKDAGEIVNDINAAIIAINNAVQISLYSYQTLGERKAQLSVVKEHMTFIKQVLLKDIEYERDQHTTWKLISSFGRSQSTSTKSEDLPQKLYFSCEDFIENRKNDSITSYLEDKSNVEHR